jgi:ubiquinone/menaquinone biosynthesis C-methylase UbiE
MRQHSGSTNFDWIANDYLRLRGGDRRITETVDLLEEHLPKSGIVLDVGSGPGSIAASLAKGERKVVALDISQAMIRLADQVLPGAVTRADAQQLPFADETFHAAIMAWVTNHVGNAHAALSEVNRVLQPGGYLLYLSGIPTHPEWDEIGTLISRLNVLRRGREEWEKSLVLTSETMGLTPFSHGSRSVNFRQRPITASQRIRDRSYGHLRDTDEQSWSDVVIPVLDSLAEMSNPNEYRRRQSEYKFVAFRKGRD